MVMVITGNGDSGGVVHQRTDFNIGYLILTMVWTLTALAATTKWMERQNNLNDLADLNRIKPSAKGRHDFV